MRIYKVHYKNEDGESRGYEFFSSKRKAVRAAAAVRRGPAPKPPKPEVTPIDFAPTMSGILGLLDKHAGHANNG